MRPQQLSINSEPLWTWARITTDGGGGIALAASSNDVTGVAFTTDGTDGEITLSFRHKGGSGYAASILFVTAGVPGMPEPSAYSTTSFRFIGHNNAATPVAVDLTGAITSADVILTNVF